MAIELLWKAKVFEIDFKLKIRERGEIILWFQTVIWFTTQRNLSNLAFLQHCTSVENSKNMQKSTQKIPPHMINISSDIPPNKKTHIFQQKISSGGHIAT